MSKISRLLRWANVILIFFTFFAYLAPYVSPVSFWPLAFFGLIYPWLLLFNLLFIAVWAALRRWYFLFSLGCILLGWNHFRSIVGLSLSTAPINEARAISVISFNAHNLENFRIRRQFAMNEDLAAIFDKGDASIVCFQEFYIYGDLTDDYIHYLTKEKGLINHTWKRRQELATFTSFPILQTETKQFNNANGYQFVDVNVKGTRVRVFNIHLQSNSVSSAAERLAANADIQEKETWLEIRGMMGRFKRAVQKRATQAEEVAAQIAKSPYPVIVCGDFNDIPQSYAYRTIVERMNDAFRKRGSGLGFTYIGRIPALRIDYILTSKHWRILNFDMRRTSFSDHRALGSRIELLESE